MGTARCTLDLGEARSQRTPSRTSVARLVSAASSSVHKLVWCPKSRGLRCSTARSRAAPAASSARRMVWARQEPFVDARVPWILKA